LIKGESSKMVADARHTRWSLGADVVDRRYRMAALGLGLATAATAVPVWYYAIIPRLASPGVGRPWLGWLGLIFLVVVWLVGLLAPQIARLRAMRASK
jgi:hypothetical protein